jgi:hypothetical protein
MLSSLVNFVLKLLGAKSRNEIRRGKLWEITRLWSRDVSTVEKEVAKGVPLVKPEGGKIDALRVHVIGSENNVTNLTKDADLL